MGSLSLNETDWLGHIPSDSPAWGLWVDYWLLLICGGIPWQVAYRYLKQVQTVIEEKELVIKFSRFIVD